MELFQSWLSKGLGRAVTFLQENDGAAYRDAILHACLHNITYDSQCEEPRGEYLWMLIAHSGDHDFFRHAVLQHLARADPDLEEYDWPQIFYVAQRFAGESDAEMRQTMYFAFDRLGFGIVGASAANSLINLDGLEGFMFAASRFDMSSPEDNWWTVGSLIAGLEDRLGKQEAETLVASAVANDTAVENVIGAYRRYEEERHQANKLASSEHSDLAMLRSLRGDSSWASQFRRWGLKATNEELSAAANELLWDTDPEKVWGCLRLFAHRAFPGDLGRLLELSDSGHDRVKRAALVALSRIRDARVRSHALDLLQSVQRFTDGIDLLESNYEAGDFRVFKDMFAGSLTPYELHGIGMSVRHIVAKNVWPELESVLLFLYEEGPCSLCRTEFVEALIELDRLPDSVRTECHFDAEPDTRNAVSAAAGD
jgi:hypothetical protein